jgi:hypothetical protein
MAELFDIMTYDFDKRDDQLDLPETWTEIAHVTADREAGTYDMSMAIHWIFDRTNKSTYVRFSVDGTNWYEFTGEPKDKTDSNATYFAFPYAHLGGQIDLFVEIKKETGAGVLDVVHAAAWIQRVN